MAKAARVADGIVQEVVDLPADTPLKECFHPEAGFVDCAGDVQQGYVFDGSRFSPPPPQPTPPARRVFSFMQFVGRLTEAEKTALVESDDVDVRLFLMSLTSIVVSLDSPDVIAGVQMLASKNILTKARAAELLA